MDNFSDQPSKNNAPSEKSSEADKAAELTTKRREALKRIGRFSAYMTPVMLSLVSQKAVASP